MSGERNGTYPEPVDAHSDLERDLRRAADETTARWEERERELRERWQNREAAAKEAAPDPSIRDWERQTSERVERIARSTSESSADVQARLGQLRGMAEELERHHQQSQERSLWGRIKRWWQGLGGRGRRSSAD